jgi:hypothetical protein
MSAITDKQRQIVLRSLEQGMSLRKACVEADIAEATQVLRLCDADSTFASQYARARHEGYAVLAEQLIESLDDQSTDPARLRIQVDTRKWMLAKMLPKLYGDRLDLTTRQATVEEMDTAELLAIAKGKAGE